MSHGGAIPVGLAKCERKIRFSGETLYNLNCMGYNIWYDKKH
jgi:hypothetical protein